MRARGASSTRIMVVLDEIWIYPIKSCRGVQVQSARVTPAGLQYDRMMCVVDLEGTVVARCEAISQRKMPVLATVEVSLADDASSIRLCAPGMPPLKLPLDEGSHQMEPLITVQASSVSTEEGGGWWLGQTTARQSIAGSAWFSEYLNRNAGDLLQPSLLVSGGSRPASFALCFCYGRGIEMTSYPPIVPLTELASSDARFEGNLRKFADFAPFHLVNQASADFVARCSATPSYPIGSFRANFVVRTGEAWEEETWARITMRSAHSGTPKLVLRKIKECARCTAACRDSHSGRWVFPEDKLKLFRVLGKVFPRKCVDPEWGSWAGPVFGVYFGHSGADGAILRVGDEITVDARTTWDAHLRSRFAVVRALCYHPQVALTFAVCASALILAYTFCNDVHSPNFALNASHWAWLPSVWLL